MLIPDFDFRATARPGPPTIALSSKISSEHRGLPELFPIYLLLRIRPLRDDSIGEKSCPDTRVRIKPKSTMLRLGSKSKVILAS